MEIEKIELRYVIKHLYLCGKSNKEIQASIIKAYGEGVITLRTIQKRTARFEQNDFCLEDKEKKGRPKEKHLRKSLKALLEEDPYMSARDMSSTLNCSKDTVVRILREDLKMSKVNIQWIPHELTQTQKNQRVQLAMELLVTLQDTSQHKLIYTQDETWLYWKNPRKSMWLMHGAPRPKAEKKKIGAKKLMISVIWNVNGIASVVMVPRGETFTKRFFSDVVMEDFSKNVVIPKTRDKKRKIKLHCDNAKTHLIDEKLRTLNVPRLPHPAYSPDLAPCDFFLFGYVKLRLEGRVFSSDEELLHAAVEILQGIDKSTLEKVYEEWIRRLQVCVENNGEYIE